MSELKPGDGITVMEHWHINYATVTDVSAADFSAAYVSLPGWSCKLGFQLEGTLWIRGHHADGSDDVQALRAAYLLTRR